MKNVFPFRMLLSICVAVAAFASVAAEPTLTARVNTRQIYLGDSFALEVTLDQASPEGASPEFADAFEARVTGGEPRSQSSRNIMIINGRRTEEVIERTSWVYGVIPEHAGAFNMGAVSLQAAGRTLTARIPEVRVQGPEKQSHVAISLDSSRSSVLLEEPFDVTVGITVSRPGGDSAGHNPLPDGDRTPVLLGVPFLEEGAVRGAAFARPLEQVLNPLLQRREGAGAFRINQFSVDAGVSLFSLFSERRAAVFYLDREAVDWDDGRPAWRYRLNIPMKAAAEGVCRFDPARFKGAVFVGQNGEIAPVSVFAVSEPLEVRVTPPPEAGRPASFIGALGTHLAASVSLDAQTCRQGDPLKLTLELAGDLTTSNMREPALFNEPELAERFRRYGDVSSERTPDGMRYVYRVRPIVSGTIEVPALELAFYNTDTRTYETVRTAPVPLRVDPAPEMDPDQILGLSTNAGVGRMAVQRMRVPSAITVSTAALTPAPPLLRPGARVFIWGPPVVWVLWLGLSACWRRRRAVGTAWRRRAASGRAERRLLRAKTPEAVMRVVGDLLRDKAGATGDGFTPPDVRRMLEERGANPALCEELGRLLQEVFDSGFSPGADPVATVKARRGRIADCLAALRRTVLVLCVAGLVCPAAAAPDRARIFLWRQANAEAATAREPADFLQAARVYRELLDQGCVNGRVLYNYGTLLMLAGVPTAAVDAFERAEALEGALPELENNLGIALRAIRHEALTDDGEALAGGLVGDALPWYRVPLFWHYRMPVHMRMDVLLAAWVVLWLGWMLRVAGARRTGRALVVAGFLVVAVFGSSVAASHRVLDRPLPELPEAVGGAGETEGGMLP